MISSRVPGAPATAAFRSPSRSARARCSARSRLAIEALAQQILDGRDFLVDQLDLPVDAGERPLRGGKIRTSLRNLAVPHGQLVGERLLARHRSCVPSPLPGWPGPSPLLPRDRRGSPARPSCSAARAPRARVATNCARTRLYSALARIVEHDDRVSGFHLATFAHSNLGEFRPPDVGRFRKPSGAT